MKCPPRSSETDLIPASLLKELIDEVVTAVKNCSNVSLSETAFKQAIIKPLLKKAGHDPNVMARLNFSFFIKVVLTHLSKQLQLLELTSLNHLSLVSEPIIPQKQPCLRWSATCLGQLTREKSVHAGSVRSGVGIRHQRSRSFIKKTALYIWGFWNCFGLIFGHTFLDVPNLFQVIERCHSHIRFCTVTSGLTSGPCVVHLVHPPHGLFHPFECCFMPLLC